MGFTINNGILEQYTEENGTTEVIIPDGIEIIGERAFEKCNNIESVIIPDGVKKIEKFAFYWCANLLNISVPESVESIGDEAFYNTPWLWKNLKQNPLFIINGILIKSNAKGDITIPDGVKIISNYAFYGCSGLTSIKIPETVETIGKEAFKFCANLSRVTLVSDNDKLTLNSTDCIVNSEGDLNVNTRNLLDFLKVDNTEKIRIFNETADFNCKVMFAMFLVSKRGYAAALDFIKSNVIKVMKHLIDIEDGDDIQDILNLDCISENEIKELVNYAADNKKVKVKVILSTYRNDHFSMTRGFDSLLLD